MTREDLELIRTGRRRIENLTERIERLRAAHEGLTRQLTGLPSGDGDRDSLAQYVADLDDLERQLAQEVILLERQMQRTDVEINRLPAHQQQILRLRYYDALKWHEVAERAHYSERWCRRIGGRK